MDVLRELDRCQREKGYLDNQTLEELSRRLRVPLYRLEGLVGFYPHFRRTPPPRVSVAVCRDICCAMADGAAHADQLRRRLADRADVEVHEVSCLGRCEHAPAVMINDVPLAPVSLVELDRVLGYVDSPQTLPGDQPAQQHSAWRCDPYAGDSDRYETVRSLLQSGEDISRVCIERLDAAGLRGMGGAGFPTGRKWSLVASEKASRKYVICNADESEPGTFKDRVILAQLPHLVVEGMLLAALTIGAEKGIVYLRHEYTWERQALERALDEARSAGVLGDDACGSGRPFDIELFISPGGYILGEETALLEALEDKRGEPRQRPPYPGQRGLWGFPTLINNVETFALATSIVARGVDWWREQGANGFAGLKFMAVSGDVRQPGVYEVPYGLTVRELIERAGGMKDGRELLAFLPGGASSRFLPADRIDTPLEFSAMQKAGSMLGSGALIAVAQGRDLFALATNLVRFFRNESCGKCVPCRVGTARTVELLEGIGRGEAGSDGLKELPPLAETLQQTSICGLGQVALNPILSVLEHFPQAIPATD